MDLLENAAGYQLVSIKLSAEMPVGLSIYSSFYLKHDCRIKNFRRTVWAWPLPGFVDDGNGEESKGGFQTASKRKLLYFLAHAFEQVKFSCWKCKNFTYLNCAKFQWFFLKTGFGDNLNEKILKKKLVEFSTDLASPPEPGAWCSVLEFSWSCILACSIICNVSIAEFTVLEMFVISWYRSL